MPRPVKTRSTYRQQQADDTRQRIAEAARRLFGKHGYGATSIEAIAGEAGVGVRTVYAAFGTKREILSVICERWLEQAQAGQRLGQVLAEPDAGRRLRATADWLVHLYSSGFDVVLILDAAIDEDTETQALLRAKLAGRNQAMNTMIASLEDVLTIPVPDAQAVYRALAAPGVYRELVHDSGWDIHRFATWVGDVLEHHLLGPIPSQRDHQTPARSPEPATLPASTTAPGCAEAQ